MPEVITQTDFYAELGLTAHATADEIKSRVEEQRSQSNRLKRIPKHRAEAENRLAHLDEIERVLLDDSARAAYDVSLEAAKKRDEPKPEPEGIPVPDSQVEAAPLPDRNLEDFEESASSDEGTNEEESDDEQPIESDSDEDIAETSEPDTEVESDEDGPFASEAEERSSEPVSVPQAPPAVSSGARSSARQIVVAFLIGAALLIVIGVIVATVHDNHVKEEQQQEEQQRLAEEQQRQQLQREEEERQQQEEAQRQAQAQQIVDQDEALSDRYEKWLALRRDQMAPQVITVRLVNKCSSKTLQVAMRFAIPDNSGRWVTSGWWTVGPGESVQPTMATANGTIFFYAQDTQGQTTWDGSSDPSAATVPVVSNNFVQEDGQDIQGTNKRMVSMFHEYFDSWGEHPFEFTCSN